MLILREELKLKSFFSKNDKIIWLFVLIVVSLCL